MERVTEPMSEAPVEDGPRQTGSGRGGRKAGGEQEPAEISGSRGLRFGAGPPWTVSAVVHGQSPHGVESAPKVNERTVAELGNLAAISLANGSEMIEAVDDHRRGGRSLRSSPRMGKPSTWRREVVG